MPEGWVSTTVGDVMTLQRGFDITKNDQRPGPVPIISSGGISSWHDEAACDGPGVVIGRKGTLGTVFYVETPYWPHDTTLWVKDFKGNSARFTYYFLRQLDIGGFDVGSANPTLNRNHVHPIKIVWPRDVCMQHAIAEILGALDDKIAVNSAMIESLNRLVPALFERIVSVSGNRQRLGGFTEIVKGVSYRRADLRPSRAALVTLKSVTRNGTYADSGLKSYAGAYAPAQVLHSGEIVVAVTDLTQAAEVVGRAVRVRSAADYQTLVASLDLVIVRPLSEMPAEYLHSLLARDHFRNYCQSHTSGTTVLHLPARAIEAYEAPIADKATQERFAHEVRPLHERANSALWENHFLARLSDTLLPQLMSGRLRVKDAEKQVEAVV